MKEILEKQDYYYKQLEQLNLKIDKMENYTNFETFNKAYDKREKCWKAYKFFKNLAEAFRKEQVYGKTN